MTATETVKTADDHREAIDVVRTKRPRVLMVVANPATATTTGWPVGFWASELTHPYHEFMRARFDVVLASPDGDGSRSTPSPIPATSRGGPPRT